MTHSKSTRALSFALALLMLLSLSTVFCFQRAYAETDGAWQYVLNGSSVEITGYNGNDTAVVVPSKIAGKSVTAISGLYTNNAKTRAVSISLPTGLQVIKDGTFKDYTSLTRVDFPDSLTTIGANAFYGCSALTGISIPSKVTTVGVSAFAGCTSLVTVNLSSGMTEIPSRMFEGDKKLSLLTLPLYITAIGDSAFANCEALKSIIIPDNVKTIGESAFAGCTNLANITLPYELKTIGKFAFNNCTSLKKVFLPNKVKTLGDDAFKNCASLEEVYFSPSVNVIKQGIFTGCTKLTKAVFGGEQVNISGIFDVAADVTVYYPKKYGASWETVVGETLEPYNNTASITITGNKTLAPGEKSKLGITLKPSAGVFSDVYSITSSNLTVATVTPEGEVTAKAPGKATITVTDVNGTVGTATISVTLPKPTGLTITPKSTSSVELKWNETAGATGYYVYRATSKSGKYTKVTTVIDPTYTDKGRTKGKTYYYKVVAYVKSNGSEIQSAASAIKSIKVSAPTPSTVSAKKTKSGVATIKWGKSTGASGYEVAMATSKTGKYTKIATITSVSTLSYKKTDLKAGKTYYFKVRSYITVNGNKVYSPYTKVVKVKV